MRSANGACAAHEPWPIAGPPAVSLEAFARAIALDPGFGPAYEHMPALFLALGRPDEARRSAATYLALDSTSPYTIRNPPGGAVAGLECDRQGRGGADARHGFGPHRLGRRRSTSGSRPGPTRPRPRSGCCGASASRAEAPVEALRGSSTRSSWPKYLAHALAFRGHLREAFAVNERLLRQPSASPWSRSFDPFHDLSLLGIVPDSLARATYGRSLESAAGWADEVYRPATSLEGTAVVAVAGRHGGPGTLRCPRGSHGAGTPHPARGPAGSAARRDERRVPRSGAGRFNSGDSEAERDPRHALPGGRVRRQLLPPEPDAGAAPGGSR